MTAPVPVPSMTPCPPFPALGDRSTGTYNSRAYSFGTYMSDVFNAEFTALAASARTNAVSAMESANAASGSATSAAAAAGAAPWVSGATYAQYAGAIDPLDFQTYRRKVAGAGTMAPSLDTNRTTWEPISTSQAQLVAISLYF